MAVCGAGWLAIPTVGPALAMGQAGCAGDDCNSDTQTFAACGGEPVGPDEWESAPIAGTPYLDFHGERTWIFNPSGWVGARQPVTVTAYLSLVQQPNADGGSGFANASGNLAEYTVLPVAGGWQVQVLNDTCAQYYLRVVVDYAPADGGPQGAPACATASDAGKD